MWLDVTERKRLSKAKMQKQSIAKILTALDVGDRAELDACLRQPEYSYLPYRMQSQMQCVQTYLVAARRACDSSGNLDVSAWNGKEEDHE